MKNVTTGVELQLTDAVIDHIVDNMSGTQRTDTLRRTMRELRDLEAELERLRNERDELSTAVKANQLYARSVAEGYEADEARLRETLAAAFGQHPDDAPPPLDEPVQVIINARRGIRNDRWLLEGPWLRIALMDAWVVGWRPRWASCERAVEMRDEALALAARVGESAG